MYQKITEGEVIIFATKLSNSSEYYYLEPSSYLSITNFVEVMNTFIQGTQSYGYFCQSESVSKNGSSWDSFRKWRIGSFFFSKDLVHICWSNVGSAFGALLRRKGPHKPVSAYILSWYTQTWLSTISLATQRVHCCAAFSLSPRWNMGTL